MYLHHRSTLGEFFLSSDSLIQTLTRWPALKPITNQLSEAENEAFMTIAYTSFFLLDDLIDDDLSVRFFMPFEDFRPPSVPTDVGVYREYRRRSIEFIAAGNQRIKHLDA